MFLFPLIYIISFLKTLKEFSKANASGLLIFIVVAMPIYINVLSITHMYGLDGLIGILQFFKEFLVIIALFIVIIQFKKIPKFTTTDILVAIFLSYSFLFVLLPIGSYNIISKLLAFKSLSFFCILYFVGRFIQIKYIQLGKYFKLIGMMTLLAALIVLMEYLRNEHFHANTGFTNLLINYFDGEQSGNYGLIWTFETETGQKRFGSLFGSPLEMAASMVLTLSICLAYYTDYSKRLFLTKFGRICLISSFICITLALSRASFIGYLIVLCVYALITNNKKIIKFIYIALSFALVYLIYFLAQTDIYNFIIDSVTFKNASSIGHVLEWIDGFEAMIQKPFGLGLGESGRISMVSNDNIGGENQFIITGIQVGFPLLIIYIWIHINLMKKAYKYLWSQSGKTKRIAFTIFLCKIGILLPMFTSNTEGFVYLSYFTWFLSGLLINITSRYETGRSAQISTKTIL